MCVLLNNTLDWKAHAEAVYWKGTEQIILAEEAQVLYSLK